MYLKKSIQFIALNYQDIWRSLWIATAVFLILGTVTALWENPIFIREIETTYWDFVIFIPYALLIGIYFGIKTTACTATKTKYGAVLGFLGFACPTCNIIFVSLFGSSALLTYFEPIRLYLGVIGIILLSIAIYQKIRLAQA